MDLFHMCTENSWEVECPGKDRSWDNTSDFFTTS